MLIAGALVFNYVVTTENVPAGVRSFLTSHELSPIAFLIPVNIILLVLGCVLEGTAVLLIVVLMRRHDEAIGYIGDHTFHRWRLHI